MLQTSYVLVGMNFSEVVIACMLLFSDINPSSWRQGDELVRRILGPAKRVSQSHSPPTRDTLQHDGSSDSRSQMTADTQCEPITGPVVPSLLPGSHDAPPGESERTSMDIQQDVAAVSPAEQLSNSVDEGLISDNGVHAASSQCQQLHATTNASYISIQDPSLHHLSISLSGNFFTHNDLTSILDDDIVMLIAQYCICFCDFLL